MVNTDTTDSRSAVGLLARVMKDFGNCGIGATVLDFGCGSGGVVASLLALGYDAHGCDIDNDTWNGDTIAKHERAKDWQSTALVETRRLRVIRKAPDRLPYEDNTFDVVLSTSVLEHALNKEEIFRELHRILKPGGLSAHILPSKWYLPAEPHIHVPLLNMVWPWCPNSWFDLWALLGVRASVQEGKTWREVARANQWLFKNGLSYWTHGALRDLSMRVFGNYQAPMRYFMQHDVGRAAALARRLPFSRVTAWLLGHTRMYFIVSRKDPIDA